MTPAAAPGRHVVALDIARGIAALVVLLGHCTLVYALPTEIRAVTDLLLNQRAAVLLFFVLSGYVLTFAWLRLRTEERALARFYLRRMFRLLPALWVATAVSLALLIAFPLVGDTPYLSHWIHDSYRPVPAARVIKSFLAADNAVVPPTWTITIEIIGSLIVPLLVAGMANRRLAGAFIVAALAIASLVFSEWDGRLAMLAFPLQFAAGCGLALYFARTGPTAGRRALAIGLVLLFASRPLWWLILTGTLQPIEFRINAAIPALGETVGAVLLVAALASGRLGLDRLERSPLRRLGDWSYSIYLIHFPVLRLLVWLIPPLDPLMATLLLAAATVAITLVLAAAIYRFVELPGIALGKRLTGPASSARARQHLRD